MGAAAIFARYALLGAGPLAVAALRLSLASAVLLGIGAIFRERAAPISRTHRSILIAAGVALALHFATWIASLEYTTVAVSTLLVSTSPLWTTLYDAVARGRRFPLVVPVAFIGGIAGLALVTSSNHSPPPHPGHAVLGAALALGGSAAFAAYLLLVRDVRAALSTRAIVTTTYTTAAIVLVVAALVAHQPPPALSSYGAWGGILAMALISQLLGAHRHERGVALVLSDRRVVLDAPGTGDRGRVGARSVWRDAFGRGHSRRTTLTWVDRGHSLDRTGLTIGSVQ